MLSLIIAAAVPAQAAAPVAQANVSLTAQVDVPADKGPQTVQMHTREFAAGDSSGWHTHPGVELGIVVTGEFELRLADGTARRFGPGQSFSVPRGAIHNGVNVAPGPSRLAITYVYDKGQPVRTRVSPPEPK